MKNLIVNKMANVVMLTGLFLGLMFFSHQKAGSARTDLILSGISNTSAFGSVALIYQFEREMITEASLAKQNYFSLQRSLKYVPGIQLNAAQANVYSSKVSQTRANELKRILSDNTLRTKFQYVMHRAQEMQLPKELALIPVIESEYNPRAVSPVGAGGTWQLMPGTAKDFGISNQQRFELEPSTNAALSYFKDLYKEYGNWELVIAAYNAGSGRVHKAIKQNPSAATVQELKLPLETRNYVQAFFQLQNELKSYNV